MNQTATADQEVLAPDIEERIEEAVQPYKQEVALLEEQVRSLKIENDADEVAAVAMISECKRSHRNMEETRDSIVRPLNSEVKAYNKAFGFYTDGLESMWKRIERERGGFVTRKQQLIDEKNRMEIARVEQERRLKAEQEEAARQEADRLRREAERLEEEENNRILKAEMDRQAAQRKIQEEERAVLEAKRQGDAAAAQAAQEALDAVNFQERARALQAEHDRLTALETQHRLEKKAIQQDAKADIAASKSVMAAPVIHVNESMGSRTLDDGSSTGTRKKKRWAFKNGCAIETKFLRDDPRFKDIGDEFFEFNPSLMNKLVNAGVKPAGVTIYEEILTTVRK